MWQKITPVPNSVFDEHLRSLRIAELKILLVVIRQTLGWKDEKNKSERKEMDWIASSQLAVKTGCSFRSINSAIQILIDKKLIEVLDDKGRLLVMPSQRQGKQKLFFRLSSANFSSVENERTTTSQPCKSIDTTANYAEDLRKESFELSQKMRITKETITK